MRKRKGWFPMTWEDWSGGVENIYAFLEEVEGRIARGEPLTEKQKELYPVFRGIREKYHRTGRKKA